MKKEEIKNIHKLIRQTIYDIEELVNRANLEIKKRRKTDKLDAKYYVARGVGLYSCKYGKVVYTQNIDLLVLNCRRLFDSLVLLRYFNKSKEYKEIINYDLGDRLELLKSLKGLMENRIKMIPELEQKNRQIINQIDKSIKELEKKHKQPPYFDYEARKIPRTNSLTKKINDPIITGEYDSIYNISSKIIHCCPYSLFPEFNETHELLREIIFLQIGLYLEEIKKELEKIFLEEVTMPQSGEAS